MGTLLAWRGNQKQRISPPLYASTEPPRILCVHLYELTSLQEESRYAFIAHFFLCLGPPISSPLQGGSNFCAPALHAKEKNQFVLPNFTNVGIDFKTTLI